MISLTYSWEIATEAVLIEWGDVVVPRMDHFYPQGLNDSRDISAQDEAYTAHLLVVLSRQLLPS